jgi:isoleucyl-tRNA synthetase
MPYRTSRSIHLFVGPPSLTFLLTDDSPARNRLESFIRSRSEWCISRQRVWGVPIPALYHVSTGRAVLTSQSLTHILRVLDEKGVAHWWNGPASDFVPPELLVPGEETEVAWRKGTDTMDVWFDSGSSWSMLEPYSEGRKHLADVCLEGSDQHRGWFQSQLLTAVGASTQAKKQSPYKHLLTHGMVLDEHGKKMSKSLGNIVSPMEIIEGGKVRESLWLRLSWRTRSNDTMYRIKRKHPHMARRSFVCGLQRSNTGVIWHWERGCSPKCKSLSARSEIPPGLCSAMSVRQIGQTS